MNKPIISAWIAIISGLITLPTWAGQLSFLDQEHSAPPTEIPAFQKGSRAEVRVNGDLESDNAGLILHMRSSIARLEPGDLLLQDLHIRDVAPIGTDLGELADLDIPTGTQESARLTASSKGSAWNRLFQ